MKHLAFISIFLILCSCGRKIEDHYRFKSVELSFWNFEKGPNLNCIKLTSLPDTVFAGDTLVLKLSFIREYFSVDESPIKSGPMKWEKGLEGPEGKIDSMYLKTEELNFNQSIFSNSEITGYISNKMPNHGICQGENCECHSTHGFSLNEFIINYNNKSGRFKGEDLEPAPLLLFLPIKTKMNSNKLKKLRFYIVYEDGNILISD